MKMLTTTVQCGCERPICQRCAQADLPCACQTQPGETRVQATKRKLDSYQESASFYKELFDHLQTMDSYRANDIYQRFRHGFDIHTLLTQIRAGDLTS